MWHESGSWFCPIRRVSCAAGLDLDIFSVVHCCPLCSLCSQITEKSPWAVYFHVCIALLQRHFHRKHIIPYCRIFLRQLWRFYRQHWLVGTGMAFQLTLIKRSLGYLPSVVLLQASCWTSLSLFLRLLRNTSPHRGAERIWAHAYFNIGKHQVQVWHYRYFIKGVIIFFSSNLFSYTAWFEMI